VVAATVAGNARFRAAQREPPVLAKTPKYSPAATKRGSRARAKAESIVVQRERLMADLALLRKVRAGSRFVENAHRLLTRQWSGATWKAREGLLSAAAWLLELERSSDQGVATM
jgi:hypothetical protein